MFYKILHSHVDVVLPDYKANTRLTRGNDLKFFSHLSTLMFTSTVLLMQLVLGTIYLQAVLDKMQVNLV